MDTQCPQCRQIFQIDDQALRASRGSVECSRCGQRFDALRHASDAVASRAARSTTAPGDWSRLLHTDLTAALIAEAAGIARNPTQGEDSWRLTDGPAPLDFSVPDVGARLLVEPSTLASRVGREPAANPAQPAKLAANGDATLPSSAVPHPAQAAAVSSGTETRLRSPTGLAPGDEAESVATAPAGLDLATPPFDVPSPTNAGCTLPGARSVLAVATPVADNADADAPEPSDTDASGGDDDAVTLAPIYVRPPRRVSRAGVAWTIGCVVLAVVLVAQLTWAKRAALIASPETRPWMTQVCRIVPCRLPAIRDVAQLQLLARDVRPDPHASGALAITATLRNAAPFRQPWPVVTVVLSDLDGKPVAMRRFRPIEYMPDPARRTAGIAPGATAAVAFEVADPGKRAVSFRFGFQ